MTFSVDAWQENVSGRLNNIGDWLHRRWRSDVPHVVYGALTGLTLLPLVEASQGGQILPVMMTLGSIVSGVGGNLLAEQLQRWRDRTVPVTEAEVIEWATTQAVETDSRAAFDLILERLETIPQVQAQLSEADRAWFRQVLVAELSQLNNLERFQVSLTDVDASIVIQGENARVIQHVGGSIVNREVNTGGDFVGRNKQIIYAGAAPISFEPVPPLATVPISD